MAWIFGERQAVEAAGRYRSALPHYRESPTVRITPYITFLLGVASYGGSWPA